MDEEIPTELTTEISSLLKIITKSVRCSSCQKIICEPQKGSCEHNACAKCWGSSSRKCKICYVTSGVQLLPNSDLTRRVDAVMKLVKSFQDWSKIDVLSNNSSNDTENSNQKDVVLNECFYEKDDKYMNLKTYKGKQKIDTSKEKADYDEEELIEDMYNESNRSIIKMKSADAKVDEWLFSPVNRFDNIPQKNTTRRTQRQSIDENKNTNNVLNMEKSKNLKAKMPKKSNASVDSKSDKKIKAEWVNVKKFKKILKKGKREKKKLSVSVESCSKNNSNTDIDNHASSVQMIEDVSTPKCEKVIEAESNNVEIKINKDRASKSGSVPKTGNNEKSFENNASENLKTSDLILISQEPYESNNIEILRNSPCPKQSVDCLNSEKIKNVPFFYSGKLSRKIISKTKNRVPFNFHIGNMSDRWNTTSEEGLNIKIQRGNTVTSIIIQDENFTPVIVKKTKTTSTQTSPVSFTTEICTKTQNINAVVTSESTESKIIFDEIENGIKPLSGNNYAPSASINSSVKRLRIDSSNNQLDYSNPSKKNKLSISDMPLDDDMIICFDSQSQLLQSEDTNKSLINVPKSSSDSSKMPPDNIQMKHLENPETIKNKNDNLSAPNDEKLLALKKSVEMYAGNEEKSNSLRIEPFFTSVSNNQVENVTVNIGVSQTPDDCEKPHTPFSIIESDIIVEDTPQKSRTKKIGKRNSMKKSAKKENVNTLNSSASRNLRSRDVSKSTSKEKNDSDMDETLVCESSNNLNEIKCDEVEMKKKIITPSSINKFTHNVKHQSTPLQPLAKRSLTYDSIKKFSTIGEEEEFDEKQSLSKSRSCHTQSLLEKEFIDEAFGNTVVKKVENKNLDTSVSNSKKRVNENKQKLCLVCSLLSVTEKALISEISAKMGWEYSSAFTQDLTHLVIKVDANNKTQRTEKYIRALATRCWIVSFKWIEQCIKYNCRAPEDPFEVLDWSGDCGPYLMRTSNTKMFRDITFYLLPPFQLLPINALEEILLNTGGKIVTTIEEAFITDPNKISIVLVDPKDTQDECYIGMCLKNPLVPVNVEWVLECLGSGNCKNLSNWILFHLSFLPKINWPENLFCEEDELDASS